MIPDAFGWELVNSKGLADAYARGGGGGGEGFF